MTTHSFTRRLVLSRSSALIGAAASGALLPALSLAQTGKVRVGLMLPYTGTYAALGVAIENGFRLAIDEQGGKLGGRDIEWFKVDDESNPAKAVENTNKLVQRDKVDVLIGTVHSGVAMGMLKVARESGTLLIIPNAGFNSATGALCAPNVFRTSFTSWQTSYPMGKVLADRKLKKVVTITWKYAFGEESVAAFSEGLTKAGGKVVKELWVPFPNVEFQALLTEIASLKPDAVFAFFAGAGAAKFVKDYAAAGLKGKIPLFGSGFLTDGVLEAQGAAADGLETTLHYGDGIDTPRNNAFRLAYAKAYKLQPDVYAVQGYDAGLLYASGMKAVKGNTGDKAALIAALEKSKIDSPRGPWTLSRAHNPVQNIYLRKVVGHENHVTSVAAKALADPAPGCKM
ncbi:MAG: ABC transporter permease [Comamonadaceae bacterium CG1_02_60_18]|nr:MAG: ABC transporter permease [Comamonadaceae bacterium CG1_02_60_18]PIQ56597.1 MAG: ABC transporter permease [Comamonadaceae bacterium CG12_big_fil_rev_8_21_14_0_65_59_15]